MERSIVDWKTHATARRRGGSGGRISASGSGAPCGRTTAPTGNAWGYFTHDQARSRAYHWGEDGLAGFSDDEQRLCLGLALWNGQDAILKERLFGLDNAEGNHGEDVKEYYFYLDSTPTHSYMKWLYKYPQRAFPYADLGGDQPRSVGRTTTSTSCSTPASSPTVPTSTSKWSM